MLRSLLISSAVALSIIALSHARIEADDSPSLLVYVIDCAGVEPTALVNAEHVMTRAFGAAGVRARWRDTSSSPVPAAGPNQITVVILSKEMTDLKARRDNIAPTALATAAPSARRAWVFLDRVAEAAVGQRVTLGAALGTVIAHEAAHVAAGMPHASGGIMGRDLRLSAGVFEGFNGNQGRELQAAMRASVDRVTPGASAARPADDHSADADRVASERQPRHASSRTSTFSNAETAGARRVRRTSDGRR